MVPKFRGDTDDWMDDEDASAGKRGATRPKGNPSAKATFLAPEEANATVAEVFPKLCRARLDSQDGSRTEILCSYRRAGVVGQADVTIRERTPVAVGDRVHVTQTSPDSGVVEGVCARTNRLTRPAPGREGQQHVLAANVDVVAIVASLRSPDFSPGLIDRFLIGAQVAGALPIICVTKIDLLEPGAKRPWDVYTRLGWRVIEISKPTGLGIAELRSDLLGKTVVFCGRSGAGKTSLLAALLEGDAGRVGEVSGATGKGKHTTTSAILLGGPGTSRWIDTPGVREFGLFDVRPERLKEFFPEFQDLKCSQQSCEHAGEAGCQATELGRHASYLRILESLRTGEG
jgi:ribosome biogenesis GTPase